MLYLRNEASFVLTGMEIFFLSSAKPQIPENVKLLLIISGWEAGRLHGNLDRNKSTSLSFPKTLWAKKICKYLTAHNHIAKNRQTKP